MTSTLRTLAVAAASAALLITLSACSTPSPDPTTSASAQASTDAALAVPDACEGDEGVTVVVDASALGDADDVSGTWCVSADDTIGAADALTAAQVQTEGTDQYGDQVVCRVNGVPAEDEAIPAEDGSDYFEKCESMPAAFAYWSLWVKPTGGEWGYAQEGLATQQLEPGDAVELLFTLNGEPAAPAS
ncbi:hypothetical protein [Microbacterium kyungheense]|uniref:DUF4430 domain-containing protein n=1 Tax=Microbacterium kyungheense TaxID=1263636 RepID=A0A543EE29_9MICO|nr:hypothetical protein [Microbacterium kyungheense]TQM19857.1 hypothetical protein FB391_3697 [Microbacterium kyungheense]